MSDEAWWQCAWCKCWFTHGGIKQPAPPNDLLQLTSHGICRECQQKELAKIPQLIFQTTT